VKLFNSFSKKYVSALVGLFAGLVTTGCAIQDPMHAKASATQEKTSSTAPAQAPATEAPKSGKKLVAPTELEKLLDAKPITLAAVKPAGAASTSTTSSANGNSNGNGNSTINNGATKSSEKSSTGKGNFRLQIGAESDIDAAQAKKATYEKQLGGTVDMVFDAPYYKLRWGYFASKQDAEDKLLELSDFKIQGFVVK